MRTIRVTGAFALMVFLGGCGQLGLPSADAAAVPDAAQQVQPFVRPAYDLRAVEVQVPETLRVSEANAYYPLADIVWRGEERGDRHAQVRAIFEEAAKPALAERTDGRPVIAGIEVQRFHALTEKARYTVGGVHSIRFLLTVRDAESGAILEEPRQVIGDLRAAGGGTAIEEDAMGLTQKVLITRHLAEVIGAELAPTPPQQAEEEAGQ
ncbi:MAG: DUF6778 family protein [Paracoccaceae bacterium]